jgi:glycosyltransferase involved in cell wall biosynthesis
MRTAAIIPAFNEAESIASVVDGLRGHVATVIVVDDGSTDGTAERARAAGADVIVHPQNLGKGHAVRAGLARVAAEDFTHVLLLDGDMQHLPHEAARLIEAAERTGADAVLGSRVLSSFVGTPIRDTQCGFRVFRIEALLGLRLKARRYDIETEMLIKLCRRGGRVTSVPITAVYAGQRSKLRPIRDTTRTCFLAVCYRYIERI